ncbi:heme-binding protein [Sphingobium boeckii]|uniref:Uncharacterized protein GlcG (DUF336 family) n=1 Tax=Sphingobium boeckii TaxID=1082345 RepID=A0A7W9AL99_9SPHN|nr:uncharacterized protein GlcG (DUF336 family) [Sphingobium boeckii]
MKRIILLGAVCAVTCIQNGRAIAQDTLPAAITIPAPPAPTPVARDPISLPGDNLPPPLAIALAIQGTTGPRAPAPRAVISGPSLDIALEAAQAALEKCRADDLKVGTAVSDSLGVMVVGLQMSGANPGRIYNAVRKNIAAIEFGEPTSAVREKLRAKDYATLLRVRPNMTLFPGGVPLISDGKVIGAIAVSGATAEQDEACAAAGAAAVSSKL